MFKLNPNFSTRLLDLLLEIDQLNNQDNRHLLLRGLSKGPVRTISRSSAMMADLNNILNAAEAWGQIKSSGEWALVMIAKNALRFVKGTQSSAS